MPIRNMLIVALCGASLGGCTSLNDTASKMGVNFWSKTAKKAPCKSLASANEQISSDDIYCVGVPLDKPSESEIIELRGRYIVENGIIVSPIQAAP